MRAHITVILSITFCFLAHAQSVKTVEKVVGFHNIDVFDGTRMIRGVNVVVVDGIIRAIGAQVSLPAQADILLPGLFDSHTHLGEKFVQQFLRDALDMGITTELEMGGSPVSLEVRKQGCADCADFLTAGTVVTAPGGHPTQMGGPPIPTLSESDDAHIQAFVDSRLAEGSDYIKIIDEHRFPTLTSVQIQGIVVAAHRRNKMAIAHIGSQREAVECLQAGVECGSESALVGEGVLDRSSSYTNDEEQPVAAPTGVARYTSQLRRTGGSTTPHSRRSVVGRYRFPCTRLGSWP